MRNSGRRTHTKVKKGTGASADAPTDQTARIDQLLRGRRAVTELLEDGPFAVGEEAWPKLAEDID